MKPVMVSSLSVEDYLQGELQSNVRHEYIDGYTYAMAGAGRQHNTIAGNIFSALRQVTRGTECRSFIADMKVHLPHLNCFYYPDTLLACDIDDDNELSIEKPCLIVEVLSPSTEMVDRREKLHAYQSIPSLREYVLVTQNKAQVELFRRNGDIWQYFLLNEDDSLQLRCVDIALSMSVIYEDVAFPELNSGEQDDPFSAMEQRSFYTFQKNKA